MGNYINYCIDCIAKYDNKTRIRTLVFRPFKTSLLPRLSVISERIEEENMLS